MAEETTVNLEGILEPKQDNVEVVDDEGASTEETLEQEASSEEESQEQSLEESKEEDPLSTLNSRLEEIEKANKGLLETLKAERRKRQELQERFSQISEVLTAVQLRKQLDQEEQQKKAKPNAIPIEIDEEGNPLLPVDKLKEVLKEEIEPLQQEVIITKEQQIQQQQIERIEKEVQRILSEDPAYPKAMEELSNEWQDVNALFDNFLESTELPPPQDPQTALDMLYSSGIEQEFQKRYPGADMESLVEAFMAVTPNVRQRKLRKALKMVSKTIGEREKGKEEMNLLQKLAGKSNFSGAPNQAKGATLNDIPDMRTFLALSDAEAQKIYDLME